MALSKAVSTSFLHVLRRCNLGASDLVKDLTSDVSAAISDGKFEDCVPDLNILITLLESTLGEDVLVQIESSNSVSDVVADKVPNIGPQLKSRIIDLIVVPLLKKLPHIAMVTSRNSVQPYAFHLLKLAFAGSSESSQENVLKFCLSSVEIYNCEKHVSFTREEIENVEGVLDILSMLELLNLCLDNCSQTLNKGVIHGLLKALVKILSQSGITVTGHVVGTVLPKVLQWDLKNLNENLKLIYMEIQKIFQIFGQKSYRSKMLNPMSDQPYLILCGLADWFFPVEENVEVVKPESKLENDPNFWLILQSGFFHVNCLTRKRSMYLLKRILDITETQGKSINSDFSSEVPLFWWNPEFKVELSTVWQDFVLLVETLEEKQVHVIKPLMPRLQNLVLATAKRSSGHPFLHTSWITVIIQRASGHESVHIKRWAVANMLCIDMSSCPMLDQTMEQFLCGDFITALTESGVYYKPTVIPLGKAPPIAHYMATFFQSCHKSLPVTKRKEFFQRFIQGVKRQNWSGAALVYVMQGIAQLPAAPCLDEHILPDIREVLTSVMSTLEIFFRAAIQCFLTRFLINLLDMSTISIGQVMGMLNGLVSEESLQRGTGLWSEVVQWVKVTSSQVNHWSPHRLCEHVQTNVEAFLQVGQKTEGSSDLVSSQECLPVVRLLVILCDAGILANLPSGGFGTKMEDFLHPVLDVLQSASTHAYLPAAKADRALLWFDTLIAEIGADHDDSAEVMKAVRQCTCGCFTGVVQYIQRRIMDSFTSVKDVHAVKLYCCALDRMVRLNNSLLEGSPAVPQLIQTCIRILTADQPNKPSIEVQMGHYAAMSLFASIFTLMGETPSKVSDDCKENLLRFIRDRTPVTEFTRPDGETDGLGLGGRKSHGESKISWGKVSSDFLAAQWTCLDFLMRYGGQWSPHSTEDCVPYMEASLETLDLLTGDGVVPVLQCMAPLIPRVIPDLALQAMEAGWIKVKEVTGSSSFWPTFSAFVKMSFCLVSMASHEQSNINKFLRKVGKEIISLGEEKHAMVLILVSHLCQYYLERDEYLGNAHKYKSILLEAVMFGPVHSKPQRFLNEVQSYLVGLEDSLPSNQILKRQAREECLVRVTVLSLLSRLKPDNDTHKEFAQMLINELMQKHHNMVSEVGHRNFSNSLSHREKHRIVTALIILEPFIEQTTCLDYCLKMLVQEYQPSVRLYCEWLLIRLLYRNPSLIPKMWTELDQCSEKKAACLCSLLSITAHIAKLQEGSQKLESYVRQALPKVVPWCMSHHFNTRTYAQACLISMWEMCHQQGMNQLIQDHSIIQAFTEFTSNNSNARKNTRKLQENFFFTFHPLRDYSIQTIFYTLPYLTMLIDEEWIPHSMFEYSDNSWSSDLSSHSLPLVNPTDDLEKCEPGAWKVKWSDPENGDAAGVGDVQKKMIPWKNMLPEKDLDLDIQESYSKKRSTYGGLVLVTSLIDKIPNLGGLCRTCEIFGVSEYVIGSLKYVQDKTFETLSVTAHKWISIKEVKPHHLKEYLLEMKQQGYTLVGVEQTANSVCLTKYTFPTKTLLLLGNEKEGIPVDLIQLLDVCVEIPQQGIIRSLNVHVSGALLIWEYSRQRMNSKK